VFQERSAAREIYYLLTTPIPRPAFADKPVERLGDKNGRGRPPQHAFRGGHETGGHRGDRRLLDSRKRLELAAGDGYHWQGPAYQIITDEIAKRVLPALGKK
jgi:hypothetical protein